MTIVASRATRVAGPGENLAHLLLAKVFDVPVCPHAGGVGLCELVVHLACVDYAIVSRSQQGRVVEFVDQQHEHFVAPVRVERGRYRAPTAPGNGAQLLDASVAEHRFPDGPVWARLAS